MVFAPAIWSCRWKGNVDAAAGGSGVMPFRRTPLPASKALPRRMTEP
ncbi:hypothetical protein KNP414_03941 [Paenibacillus mucilaginosus KNP414]|uniref:Uncharacterized protein n=1 Tax=Paenibacillus mucilaginosus (strain KNP414) TaxID=1036673 RepID=F8F931_PAEMK|nr:hypothetical protein KNP414_03941 [Paenibacillus mucilaginosus KNP414]